MKILQRRHHKDRLRILKANHGSGWDDETLGWDAAGDEIKCTIQYTPHRINTSDSYAKLSGIDILDDDIVAITSSALMNVDEVDRVEIKHHRNTMWTLCDIKKVVIRTTHVLFILKAR